MVQLILFIEKSFHKPFNRTSAIAGVMGLPPGVEWACPYENPPPVIYDNLTLYNVRSLKNSGFIGYPLLHDNNRNYSLPAFAPLVTGQVIFPDEISV